MNTPRINLCINSLNAFGIAIGCRSLMTLFGKPFAAYVAYWSILVSLVAQCGRQYYNELSSDNDSD